MKHHHHSGASANSISVKGVYLVSACFNLDYCLACLLATQGCIFPLVVQECTFFNVFLVLLAFLC